MFLFFHILVEPFELVWWDRLNLSPFPSISTHLRLLRDSFQRRKRKASGTHTHTHAYRHKHTNTNTHTHTHTCILKQADTNNINVIIENYIGKYKEKYGISSQRESKAVESKQRRGLNDREQTL